MPFASNADLHNVDKFILEIDDIANVLVCKCCKREFLTENRLTCARKHVRTHIDKGEIVVAPSQPTAMQATSASASIDNFDNGTFF